MSSLLPSLGQVAVACATFVVAAVCVGLGQLVGARRPALALVAGWGVGGLLLLIATTIAGMPVGFALAIVGVLGAVGLVLVAQGSFDEESWEGAGRTLLLAVPFLWIAATMTPGGFDEYSHWLPNMGYLYLHGHFPTAADPNVASVRPGYPYGLAFIGVAASMLSFRLAEGAGIIWNALLLVAFGSLCGEIISTQIKLRRGADYLRNPIEATDAWGIAAVGLLAGVMLSPSFVPRLFLSNYGDGPVGSVTGIVTGGVMLWVASEARGVSEARLLLMGALGLCCAALVNIRQDSLPLFTLVFIAAVAATPLERRLDREIKPGMLLLLLPAPLLVALIWHEYQVTQIPEGVFSVLPFTQWHWATLPSALWQMLLVVVTKAGHFGLLLILIGATLMAIDTPDLFTPLQRAGVVMATVLGLGKTATMVVLYVVADFSESQAAAANEFWRFSVQVGPPLVAAGVSLIPTRIWDWPRTKRIVCIAAPVLAVLLPLVFLNNLRVDSPRQSHALYLRAVAADIATLTQGASRITLVEPNDAGLNLGEVLPVRYELLIGLRPSLATPVPKVEFVSGAPLTHIVADGILPVDVGAGRTSLHRHEDMQTVMNAPFVWFYDGGKAASDLAGIPLPAGASYLIARHDGESEVVKTWTISGLEIAGRLRRRARPGRTATPPRSRRDSCSGGSGRAGRGPPRLAALRSPGERQCARSRRHGHGCRTAPRHCRAAPTGFAARHAGTPALRHCRA